MFIKHFLFLDIKMSNEKYLEARIYLRARVEYDGRDSQRKMEI